MSTLPQETCSDCPPVGYPTDETRCAGCPRKMGEADVTDFMIMRHGQRNPRVAASNYVTGEPIHYGGRRQP